MVSKTSEGGFMTTEEFIEPGADCMDEGDVPQKCQQCGYLRGSRTARPESFCSLMFSYEKLEEDPECAEGRRVVEKANRFEIEVVDVLYGWKC